MIGVVFTAGMELGRGGRVPAEIPPLMNLKQQRREREGVEKDRGFRALARQCTVYEMAFSASIAHTHLSAHAHIRLVIEGGRSFLRQDWDC